MNTHFFIGIGLAAGLALAAGGARAVSVAQPFAYPQSLLAGNPAEGDAAAPGMTLGALSVRLEETPIREAAKAAGASLMREGAGEFTRDWTCLRTDAFRVWLVASDSPAVTEVQMEEGKAASVRPGACYALPASLSPASIGGVIPGMTKAEVQQKLGAPSYAGEDGWVFWAHFRTLSEYSSTRIRMNWTGVQTKDGRVTRVFSSQVTNP